MADVKDGDIVFEYPDDDEVTGNKLPDEKEIKTKQEKTEVKVETKADDIDLEIEDDTPPADKNKEPLPKEIIQELENDNLEDYSERVKQRMAQLKKAYHDERRDKEEADRERQEAIKYAQQLNNENKKLKTTLESGESTYIETLKNALESELSLAKESYRKAYDTGETDSIIDAQQKMNDAQFRLSQARQYEPRFKNAYRNLKILYIYNKMNNVRLNPTIKPQLGKKRTTGLVKTKK